MQNHRAAAVVAAILGIVASAPVMAYVGPGAGLTLLSALWGLLVAVGVAFGFVLLWPIRRMRRRRAGVQVDAEAETDTPDAERDTGVPGPGRDEVEGQPGYRRSGS